MKLLISIITLTLIICEFSTASTLDTLILKTKKFKGISEFSGGVGNLETMSPDNYWYPTIPKIKNIPNNLGRLMFVTLKIDMLQHAYQNFHLGNISEQFFLGLQKSWDWYPDSINYTKSFVKVNVAIAAGENKEGEIIVYVDKNNNYDLGDDIPFKLPPKLPGQDFWDRYNDNLVINVNYNFLSH